VSAGTITPAKMPSAELYPIVRYLTFASLLGRHLGTLQGRLQPRNLLLQLDDKLARGLL
jgi:hypothetical protein